MSELLLDGQRLHAGALAVLLLLVLWATTLAPVAEAAALLWLAVGIAVTHQVYVWLCWRLALAGRIGSGAFPAYAAGFAVLGLTRAGIVIVLAVRDRGSLGETSWISTAIAVALLVPVAYLLYSIRRYFGFGRAVGADHFFSRYREMPLVREGIFRWTSNAMYTFGFLFFWAVAIWAMSAAALAAAAFNSAYIWVHYFATERPDMRRIYG